MYLGEIRTRVQIPPGHEVPTAAQVAAARLQQSLVRAATRDLISGNDLHWVFLFPQIWRQARKLEGPNNAAVTERCGRRTVARGQTACAVPGAIRGVENGPSYAQTAAVKCLSRQSWCCKSDLAVTVYAFSTLFLYDYLSGCIDKSFALMLIRSHSTQTCPRSSLCRTWWDKTERKVTESGMKLL